VDILWGIGGRTVQQENVKGLERADMGALDLERADGLDYWRQIHDGILLRGALQSRYLFTFLFNLSYCLQWRHYTTSVPVSRHLSASRI
jgi:hypothetical protein